MTQCWLRRLFYNIGMTTYSLNSQMCCVMAQEWPGANSSAGTARCPAITHVYKEPRGLKIILTVDIRVTNCIRQTQRCVFLFHFAKECIIAFISLTVIHFLQTLANDL